MQVIYAPSRVMVNWVLPQVSEARLRALHAHVRALAEDTSRELAVHHPAASLHPVDESYIVGFTVTDADADDLDQLRSQLDHAAIRFTQGACEHLIVARPPAVLTSASP